MFPEFSFLTEFPLTNLSGLHVDFQFLRELSPSKYDFGRNPAQDYTHMCFMICFLLIPRNSSGQRAFIEFEFVLFYFVLFPYFF